MSRGNESGSFALILHLLQIALRRKKRLPSLDIWNVGGKKCAIIVNVAIIERVSVKNKK